VDDWNVVATARAGGFRQTARLLRRLGVVDRTGLFNVLVMKTTDVRAFLEALRQRAADDPEDAAAVGRVVPVTRTFGFDTPAEFEAKAREAALGFAPQLAGKAFHVRFHRRGHKGELSTPGEERFLDEALLDALRAAGAPGRISFEDPDAVVMAETVGNRAGLAVWGREDWEHYPFLRPH
jgi:tRNA(Ser,Leu) C12 N-acetylase TAN1